MKTDDQVAAALLHHVDHEIDPDMTTEAEIKDAHRRLVRISIKALNDFRYKYDVPGVRYWEIYYGNNQRSWHTTLLRPEDPAVLPRDAQIVELTRLEFRCRQRPVPDDVDDL